MPSKQELKVFKRARYFVFHKMMYFLISSLGFFLLMSVFSIQYFYKFSWLDNFMNTDLFFGLFFAITIVFVIATIAVTVLFIVNKEYRENYIKMGAYTSKYGKGQLPFIKKINDPKTRFWANTILFFAVIYLVDYFAPKFTSKLPTAPDRIMGFVVSLCVLFLFGMVVWMIGVGCKKPQD